MRIAAALVVLLAAAPAAAQTLDVIGPAGRHAQLDRAALAAFPRERVSVTHEGRTRTFEGASLGAVALAVGADPADLTTVLRVSAFEGRQAVITLPETGRALRAGRVIIAFAEAGRPLAAGEGSFRLVLEDDLNPARSGPVDLVEVLRLADPGN